MACARPAGGLDVKLNDAVLGTVLLLLAAAVLVHVQSFGTIPGQKYGPALFPGLVAVGLAVCGALLVGKGLAARTHGRARARWVAFEPWTRSRRHVIAFATTLGVAVFYILLADRLGFVVIGVVYLAALFVAYGVRPAWIVPLAVVLTLVVHTAFYKLLKVPLPWGLLQRFAW